MTHILRHGLVFFQFFEENIPVKMANILKIAEYNRLFSFQCCWHVRCLLHWLVKLGECQFQVLGGQK